MITLRPNQVDAVRIGKEYLLSNNRIPSIMVMPTAWGKSIGIAKIAEGIPDKLLILQPSKELLSQNYAKYSLLGGQASVYSASFGSRNIGHVTYATIGTLKKYGSMFRTLGFTKMIIDECHLYPRSDDSMLGTFLKESGIRQVLGLTATPLKLQTNRDQFGNSFSKLVMLTSRSKMGTFFKEIIYVAQIQEMVELGYWSKLEYETFDFDEGKLIYNSTKADFTDESLRAVYKSNDTERKIIETINSHLDRKSIIVFVPSVAAALSLHAMVPNSIVVYSGMPDAERERAVDDFKAGRKRIAINVNILAVGFDSPGIDMIVCGRPTASLAWYYQALGRGTRILAGKKDCLVVDFSGNVRKFGPIEHLYFRKENVWKMYGEGGRLLTGVPLHEIGKHTEATEQGADFMRAKKIINFGKHKGKELKNLPSEYRKWMLSGDIKYNEGNQWMKDELLRIRESETVKQ